MSEGQWMAIKDVVYKIQLSLLDGIDNQTQLFTAGSLMSRADYEDVVTERTIANLCGYPLCRNSLPSAPERKGRYRISLKEHKVYDLQETSRFCSSGCLINSRAFSGTLKEDRCMVLNPVKLNEILSLFEHVSVVDDSSLGADDDFRLSRLKIQENKEPKGGEVSLEEWMGPSNAIEGYVPKSDNKPKPSRSKNRKEGSDVSFEKSSSKKEDMLSSKKDDKSRSKKDFVFNEMDFMSTIIANDEYCASKLPKDSTEVAFDRKSEEPKGKGSSQGLEQQAAVSGSLPAPRKKNLKKKSRESKGKSRVSKEKLEKAKGKVTIFEEDKSTVPEVPQAPCQNDTTNTWTVEAEKELSSEHSLARSDKSLKSSLKSSSAKKLIRSVTWADEKTSGSGSGSDKLCEVRMMDEKKAGPEVFLGIDTDDENKALRFASAEACARALSEAAEVVVYGDTDVNDAVSEAGIIILPYTDQADENKSKEGIDDKTLELEPSPEKWPKKPGVPNSDLFDPDQSWFDEPPEGFSLTLSTFAMMWNALFGWVTSSSLAYIYGRHETFHEEYLFVNGREYPRKIILEGGRSSEIKETLAGCLARALPGVIADLRLPVPISDLEKGLVGMLDTMSFTEALPAFRMKQWQAMVLLFIDALSISRIPSATPYMTSGRMLHRKVLDGAGIGTEEYEIMKDLLIPLGRAPQFSSQSGG